MTLAPGTRLGPYEIVSPLDSGGMGDVYTARDTRLDRLVAIKTSRAEFSERFEREARAVAALNHPNICQLYDVGPSSLVMERVNGTPISRRTTSAGCSTSPSRSRTAWPRRTRRASSIATSSRRTCS